MTISLKHAFQSAKGDPPDNTLVRPSDWNAEHVLTCATDTLLGRTSSGTGPVEEIAISDFMQSLLSAPNASALVALISSAITSVVSPPGQVIWTASHTVPPGWLQCNGQAVSRTTYAALFSWIGTTYGAGDGVTTFNVPDLRGRVVAGYDPGAATGRLTSGGAGINSGVMGAAGGAQTHTLSISEMPQHTHSASTPITTILSGSANALVVPSGQAASVGVLDSSQFTQSYYQADRYASCQVPPMTVTVQNQGGSAAHNNTQPTIVLMPIIKT